MGGSGAPGVHSVPGVHGVPGAWFYPQDWDQAYNQVYYITPKIRKLYLFINEIVFLSLSFEI